MTVRAICVAFLIASLPVAGCGTVANLAPPGLGGGKVPFGGVSHDEACIDAARNPNTGAQGDYGQFGQAARVLLWTVDLPFSFVGDVVSWPYTWAYSRINQSTSYPPLTISGPPPAQTLPVPAPPATQPTPTAAPPAAPPMSTPYPPATPVPATSQPKTSP